MLTLYNNGLNYAKSERIQRKNCQPENTAKVTKTMNMVSSAKFRKAQDAQNNSRLYANQLKGVIGRLAGAIGSEPPPLMEVREESSKALVVVFASDKGLCGGFNNNLIKYVKNWMANDGKSFSKIDFITTSKRATNGMKEVGNIIRSIEDKLLVLVLLSLKKLANWPRKSLLPVITMRFT